MTLSPNIAANVEFVHAVLILGSRYEDGLLVPSGIGKLLPVKEMLVGAVGVEPTTNGLKGRCSATELRPCFSCKYLT